VHDANANADCRCTQRIAFAARPSFACFCYAEKPASITSIAALFQLHDCGFFDLPERGRITFDQRGELRKGEG
jgi:hypothetical protein